MKLFVTKADFNKKANLEGGNIWNGVQSHPDEIASAILALNASKQLFTLNHAMYPNLAELARLRGISGPIETLLAARASILEIPETVHVPTITWTGTTPPSGTQTGHYIATKMGKRVTVKFWGRFATPGADLTDAEFEFPAALPEPAGLTGLAANGNIMAHGFGGFMLNQTIFYNSNRCWIKKIIPGQYKVLFGTTNNAFPDSYSLEFTYWTN